MSPFAWITWDPPREAFIIPFLERPVVWYGVFFAFGFLIGYFVMVNLLKRWLEQKKHPTEEAVLLVDRLTWVVVLGTVIGARLGDVFFYSWDLFRDHPWDIFKVWEGGLASHGGVIGILLGLVFFRLSIRKKWPELRFLTILDLLVIPTAFASCCIRIGNFFNQEIIGTFTTLPWAVLFGRPVDGGSGIPRHPVQLYEALFYLMVFVLLFWLSRKKMAKIGSGYFSGLFFLLVFGFRFCIEMVKEQQPSLLPASNFLQMGQLLSLPFILLGGVLLFFSAKNTTKLHKNIA